MPTTTIYANDSITSTIPGKNPPFIATKNNITVFDFIGDAPDDRAQINIIHDDYFVLGDISCFNRSLRQRFGFTPTAARTK